MVNQSLNKFYTRFLFKIDALTQDVTLPLDIAATFFNNLIPDVRELLIPGGVQPPTRMPTETNHQGNHRLLFFRNAAVEVEKNTRTIRVAVKPASGSRNPRTFMGILRVNTSIQIAGLGSSFQS